jgi:hypothetical protein
VKAGLYEADWGCTCDDRRPILPPMPDLDEATGE